MKKEEESTSEFSIFKFQFSIYFVTFVSYLKEYGRTGTDIIIETEQ